MKFSFMHKHRSEFPITAMCRALGVSHSGFYRWQHEPHSKREQRRDALAHAIKRVHATNRGVYGSPRVCAALQQEGIVVCRNTVARVMKVHGIKAKTHRKFRVSTTDSKHAHAVAPNVLARAFHAGRPNQVWLTDITCIPTDEGWLYLAGVMDMCSRKIVGWSMAEHLRAELTCDALRMALQSRKPTTQLVHHSDRGVQYACAEYRQALAAHNITVSMSRTGNCYDNAPQESFWGKLKTELVYQEHFHTTAQARAAVFDYIETFYNRQRLHSSLGYLSPETFEARLKR